MKYMNSFTASVAALLIGIAPSVMAEEKAPEIPASPQANVQCEKQPGCAAGKDCRRMGKAGFYAPGMRPQMGRDGRRHCPLKSLMPRSPMSEDDMAKFAELGKEVKNAMENFRAQGSDANKAAVKAALVKLVEARQQFEIDRCEKALARAKAQLDKKDKIVERQLKKLTEAPKKDPDGRPGKFHGRKGPKGMKEAPAPEKVPAPAPETK